MVDLGIDGKKIEGVGLMIFDRDGTLIDVYTYWSQMVRYRAELICERLGINSKHKKELMYAMGIDEKNRRIRSEGPVGLKKREVVMQAAVDYLSNIGHQNTHDLCFRVFNEVDRISYDKLDELVKPLDGLYDLFTALNTSSCKIAIATTDKLDRAKLIMDHLMLSKKIDYIVGADSVKNGKPAPDMINLIVKELGIPKSKTVMVGDAITDVKMGLNSEIRASIGVGSGLTPERELRRITAYVIKDISKIKIT
ncbi:MAG: HAD-IA family hydrolase [Candidatus Altiarchaeota archaeon]